MHRKYKAWLKDTLHHRSQYTTLCWTSAIALLINSIILVTASFTTNDTWYELTTLFTNNANSCTMCIQVTKMEDCSRLTKIFKATKFKRKIECTKYNYLNYCRYPTLPYEGLTVCCLVVVNFILVVSDNKLRHKEIPHRVRILLDQLEGIQTIYIL